MAKTSEPSDTTLEETPGKALKFLGAIGTNPNIEAALAKRGFSAADKDEGWNRLFVVTGYKRPVVALLENPAARAAVTELDQWDNPNFTIIEAALAEDFPAQNELLFDNLEASSGVGSIVAVATLLDRLDQLESGKDRPKSERKADLAALQKLARRGYPKEERARLRALVVTAKGDKAEGTADGAKPAPQAADGDAPLKGDARRKALRSLWAWLNEWKAVAKAEITRRDWLIALGLVTRKVTKKAAPKKGSTKAEAPKDAASKGETAAQPAPKGNGQAAPNGGE